jgi:ubiquitin thioesterase protein OTUB1
VLTGFHGHGQVHAAGQQYAVGAPSHYEAAAAAAMVHSGLSFARPLPMRAPVLVPAGFNHHHPQHPQHTGHQQQQQQQHGRIQNDNHNHNHNHGQLHSHAHNLSMADPYLASDEDMARLQKLSSEWEPEATVSCLLCLLLLLHGRG